MTQGATTIAQKSKIIYKCSSCRNSNKQKVKVLNHILQNHYDDPEVRMQEIHPSGAIQLITVKDLGEIYNCLHCKKLFRVQHYLTQHMRKIHKQQSNPSTAYNEPFLDQTQQVNQQQEAESEPYDLLSLATQIERSDFYTPEKAEPIDPYMLELERILESDDFET